MGSNLDNISLLQQNLAKTLGKVSNLVPGKHSDRANPLTAPWIAMGDGGFPLANPAVIPTPAITGGPPYTWTDILNYSIPNGFDGVIKRIAHNYNGAGFVQGSGTLIWRMLINSQAVRNYDNILVYYGDNVTGYTDGIRLRSGDIFQYQVTNVGLAGAATQIFAFTGGWYYPTGN